MKSGRYIICVLNVITFLTVIFSPLQSQIEGHTDLEGDIQGHSHNDYRQDLPLLYALRLGIKSIEADIHPYGTLLKVCHSALGRMGFAPNLEDLYLAPLDSIIRTNDGFVFPGDSTPVILMNRPEDQEEKINSTSI